MLDTLHFYSSAVVPFAVHYLYQHLCIHCNRLTYTILVLWQTRFPIDIEYEGEIHDHSIPFLFCWSSKLSRGEQRCTSPPLGFAGGKVDIGHHCVVLATTLICWEWIDSLKLLYTTLAMVSARFCWNLQPPYICAKSSAALPHKHTYNSTCIPCYAIREIVWWPFR